MPTPACASGSQPTLAASLLMNENIHHVTNCPPGTKHAIANGRNVLPELDQEFLAALESANEDGHDEDEYDEDGLYEDEDEEEQMPAAPPASSRGYQSNSPAYQSSSSAYQSARPPYQPPPQPRGPSLADLADEITKQINGDESTRAELELRLRYVQESIDSIIPEPKPAVASFFEETSKQPDEAPKYSDEQFEDDWNEVEYFSPSPSTEHPLAPGDTKRISELSRDSARNVGLSSDEAGELERALGLVANVDTTGSRVKLGRMMPNLNDQASILGIAFKFAVEYVGYDERFDESMDGKLKLWLRAHMDFGDTEYTITYIPSSFGGAPNILTTAVCN